MTAKRIELETMIRARVTEEQKAQLEAIAAARQLPASAIIREAVREYLAKHYTGEAEQPKPEPTPPPAPTPTPTPTPPPAAMQPQPELAGCV